MALTAEEKKRLDKLAFANGGGYSDFLTGVQKQNPSSKKTIYICFHNCSIVYSSGNAITAVITNIRTYMRKNR